MRSREQQFRCQRMCTFAQVHGDEADEVLTKLLASPVVKSATMAGMAVKPASPWGDSKAPPKPPAAAESSGTETSAKHAANDQPPAASPAAAPVKANCTIMHVESFQSPAAAAASPAQGDLTPSARAAIAAKVGSGRRLLPVRSPAGRQVSMGEALTRAARGAPATARRLEDAFAGSSAATPSDAATAPSQAANAGSQPEQQAPAGSDILLPSYLQAALAAADSVAGMSSQMLPRRTADAGQPSDPAPAQNQANAALVQATKRELKEFARLPPVSQLDVSVLDALPLHLKRELEMAYGAQLGFISALPSSAACAKKHDVVSRSVSMRRHWREAGCFTN